VSGYCDYCRKPVIFAATENARRFILNPDPDRAGRIAVSKDHNGNMHARQLRKREEPLPNEVLYMHHGGTCASPLRKRPRRPATPPTIKSRSST
jgi:hypothetical protein